MFTLNPSPKFVRQLAKLTKKNNLLKDYISVVLKTMRNDPFFESLKTRKVLITDRSYWSSRVSGDLRIIWNFNQNQIKIINLYNIGGHTGQNKVYK